MKVGSNLKDDIRRARIIRDEVGPDIKIMMDANQNGMLMKLLKI